MFLTTAEIITAHSKKTIIFPSDVEIGTNSIDLPCCEGIVKKLTRVVENEPIYSEYIFNRANPLLLEPNTLYLIPSYIITSSEHTGILTTRSTWARRGVDVCQGNYLCPLTSEPIILTVTCRNPIQITTDTKLRALFFI
jgi:hypothetical protein